VVNRSRKDILTVLDAGFYVLVSGLDEAAQFCLVDGGSGAQLHVAHEFAVALQQARGITQGITVEETYVHVDGKCGWRWRESYSECRKYC